MNDKLQVLIETLTPIMGFDSARASAHLILGYNEGLPHVQRQVGTRGFDALDSFLNKEA